MTTIERTAQRDGADVWHTRSHGRDLRTTGLSNLPRTGGAVLALTHFAHQELELVELAVWRHSRRRIQCLVRGGRVEEPQAGGLFRPLRRIVVDLTAGADAYTGALAALRHGELLALFPEAGGDDSVAVRELRVGAARLALEADIPLLPVVVWCGQLARSSREPAHGWPARAPVHVAFGSPIPMQRAEDVRAVTDELRSTMQRMLLGLLRTP
jgi:1-acyl-sn-glycerol-3-phosphate acyltransferase